MLLIEDIAAFAESFAGLLKKTLGVRVLTCANSDRAFQLLLHEPIDVVITDMRLPAKAGHRIESDMGYEIVHYIKMRRPTTHIIVFTAYPDFEDAVRCIRAGAFDYLPKVDPSAMRNMSLVAVESVRRALKLSGTSVNRDSLKERLILLDWDKVQTVTNKRQKGLALESLCSLLFGTVPGWLRIESSVRSSTEEIDLVIVNESCEEFWRHFGTVVLVECKNWSRKVKPGRKEFDAFNAKISRRGRKDCRLGFFVAIHGTARTFQIETERIAKEDVVVVTLSGDDLWNMICTEDRSRFLKG